MFEMKTSNTDPADVASIDAIITAAYDSISGLPGKRDWNRVLSLSFQLQMAGTCVPRAERRELHHPKAITHQVSINGGELQTRSLLSRSCRE